MSNVCETLTLASLCEYLKSHDNYVVLTHANPDGDTLGSAYGLKLGLKKLGKRVQVACCDEIPHKYDYFIDDSECDFIPETVVAVDVADIKLLGDLYERFEGRIDLNIDHHISNTHYANRLYLDENAAACAETVYEILDELGVEFDRNIANALYTGLSTDTGCFKYGNVTAHTHHIAAKLYKIGVDAAEINRIMFDTKSKSRVKMEKRVLDSAEFHFDDRCMLMAITLDVQRETGCSRADMEGVPPMSRSVEGVLCGITLKENRENEFKISLRTYDPLDASAICGKLGGGGHKAAAGCTVIGSLDEAKAKILEVVKEALEAAYAGTDSCK